MIDKLVESLGHQIIEEQQTYLDNARLKHGVPLRTMAGGSGGSGISGDTPPQQEKPSAALPDAAATAATSVAKSAGKSMLKTAAMLGLTAAAGAVGIPPVVSSLAGYWIDSKIDNTSPPISAGPQSHSPPSPDSSQAGNGEWNDLVGFLRSEGYDRVGNKSKGADR